MSNERPNDAIGRMVAAYEKMLERVHETLDRAEQETIPQLKENIDQAREKAVELGELTREEADKVAGYIERDLKDAATYLHDSQEEFSQWLRFDLDQIGNRLLEMFADVADRTQVELSKLAEQARRAQLYHTGEVTGPGTLVCRWCGKAMHFRKAGHIPPCPKCRGTEFRRTHAEGQEDD
jgi:hypothetical protein